MADVFVAHAVVSLTIVTAKRLVAIMIGRISAGQTAAFLTRRAAVATNPSMKRNAFASVAHGRASRASYEYGAIFVFSTSFILRLPIEVVADERTTAQTMRTKFVPSASHIGTDVPPKMSGIVTAPAKITFATTSLFEKRKGLVDEAAMVAVFRRTVFQQQHLDGRPA